MKVWWNCDWITFTCFTRNWQVIGLMKCKAKCRVILAQCASWREKIQMIKKKPTYIPPGHYETTSVPVVPMLWDTLKLPGHLFKILLSGYYSQTFWFFWYGRTVGVTALQVGLMCSKVWELPWCILFFLVELPLIGTVLRVPSKILFIICQCQKKKQHC